jgi:integrase
MVRVKDSTKRRQRPTVLTVDEYETIVGLLKEPYRTMVIVAQCLGLRVSEIAALQWQDFDFERQQLLVQRSIVNGNMDDVKTEYSRDHVPLDEALVEVLLAWSKEALPTEEGWVFASPVTDRPYHPTDIQKRHIRPAGFCLVACPKCGAGVGAWCSQVRPTPNGKRLLIHDERQAIAGKYSSIGWHTFRHTYRSWLDETRAPMEVQQELMRHALIQTMMNVSGQTMSSSKREGNSKDFLFGVHLGLETIVLKPGGGFAFVIGAGLPKTATLRGTVRINEQKRVYGYLLRIEYPVVKDVPQKVELRRFL